MMANLTTAKSITFFDVETTHLDPKKSAILSISIITDWEDGKRDVWSTKIKPKPIEMEFASPEALKVCNYNEEEWSDAPEFQDIAYQIVKRLMWGPIVGHNVQFDISHVRAVLGRYGYSEAKNREKVTAENKIYKIGYPAIDTCALAYLFLPTERQNLNALREHFNIDTSRAHDAETDVEDCRTVFYNILDYISPS